jgi:hypothetical protein
VTEPADIPAGRILPENDVVLSRQKMKEVIGQAISAVSVNRLPSGESVAVWDDRARKIADELMEAVEKFAWAQSLYKEDPEERIELPGPMIPLVTHTAGGRQVIGQAQIFGEVILAKIPLAALELGVARTLKADAAKGISLRRPEIVLKPPQMVTGVIFPTDLRFQVGSNGG